MDLLARSSLLHRIDLLGHGFVGGFERTLDQVAEGFVGLQRDAEQFLIGVVQLLGGFLGQRNALRPDGLGAVEVTDWAL